RIERSNDEETIGSALDRTVFAEALATATGTGDGFRKRLPTRARQFQSGNRDFLCPASRISTIVRGGTRRQVDVRAFWQASCFGLERPRSLLRRARHGTSHLSD